MCGVCERIQMTRDGTNPYFVKELETGYVVIGDFQHFKGYTLFIYKEHVVELFDLEPAVRAKHLEEMTLVAQAVSNAFGADGNKGKGPTWWYPREKMYADDERPSSEELEEMKQLLLKELDKLL